MRELSDAVAPLIETERVGVPSQAQLEVRVARRRRRRRVQRVGALVVAAAVIIGVATLVPDRKHAVRVTNPPSTTTPKATAPNGGKPNPGKPDPGKIVTDSAIGWRVTVPKGWIAQRSRAVCNPGELGIVVSPDAHAFSASEGNAGCFDGSTPPLPGAVVVSLSRVAPASPATPPTPLPLSLADLPVTTTAPALRFAQIIEGNSEYLVRVVLAPDAPASSRDLVDAVLRSLRPVTSVKPPRIVGARATTLALPEVSGIAFDASGNLYLADRTLNRVFVVNPVGTVVRVIGNGTTGSGGDSGAAADAQLDTPLGIAVDPAGNLYIADSFNNKIRRVTPGGIITTFAGTGAGSPPSPDGRPASRTALASPGDLLWDPVTRSLYMTEGTRVRRIGSDGIVHTVAGTTDGQIGYEQNPGGLATATAICSPSGIAISNDRSLWIADGGCDKSIARVAPDGRIRQVPGNAFRLAAAPDGSVSAYFGRGGFISRITPTIDTPIVALGTIHVSNCAHYGGQGGDSAALAWQGDTLYFANPSMERVCALRADGGVVTIVGG